MADLTQAVSGLRQGPDGASEIFGRCPRIGSSGNRPGSGDQRRALPCGEGSPEHRGVTALGPYSGDQEDRFGHEFTQASEVTGLGRPGNGPHAAQARFLPREAVAEPIDYLGQLLEKGSAAYIEILDVGGAGVARAHQDEEAGASLLGNLDEGLECIDPEKGVHRHGIGTESPEPAKGGVGEADDGLGVGPGRDRYVAPLAVGYHQEPGRPGSITDLGQGPVAGPAETLETGKLGLDRNAFRSGLLDQREALLKNESGRFLGRLTIRPNGPGLINPVRSRVQSEADLAAALFDERRSAIYEAVQPLTFLDLLLEAGSCREAGHPSAGDGDALTGARVYALARVPHCHVELAETGEVDLTACDQGVGDRVEDGVHCIASLLLASDTRIRGDFV